MPDPDDLLIRWELGQTSADDERALAELLRDPVQRRTFVRQARIAAAMGAAPAATVRTTRTRRPRTAPRRRVVLALAAGLLLALGAVAWALSGSAPYATLEVAAGAQVVGDDGQPRAGGDHARLSPGDRIEAVDAAAVIRLGDGAATLVLEPGARLRLPGTAADPAHGAVRLLLERGRLAAAVRTRRPDAPLAIASIHGSAEVVGTRFELAVDDEAMRLHVAEGVVRLAPAGGTGLAVAAGQGAVLGDGLATFLPQPDAPLPPPPGRILWQAPHQGEGWRGIPDQLLGWQSVPTPPGERWSSAEIRSPVERDGWTVVADARIRFRYHVEGFAAAQRLELHLKPADESNFAASLLPEAGPGWHLADLPLAGFTHLLVAGRTPTPGEGIHGAVWLAPRDGGPVQPLRFWVRDIVAYAP